MGKSRKEKPIPRCLQAPLHSVHDAGKEEERKDGVSKEDGSPGESPNELTIPRAGALNVSLCYPDLWDCKSGLNSV